MSADVRELLDRERFGMLATLSARRHGWPFASLAAYALTRDGEPLLLLSGLAEHTRNLRADSRASLLVQDSKALDDDPQAAARVTLLGTIEPVPADDSSEMRERYESRQPQAKQYTDLQDFKFYVLKVTEARYVNGFGDMGWIDGASLRTALI